MRELEVIETACMAKWRQRTRVDLAVKCPMRGNEFVSINDFCQHFQPPWGVDTVKCRFGEDEGEMT